MLEVVLEDGEIKKEGMIRYWVRIQKIVSHFWEMVSFIILGKPVCFSMKISELKGKEKNYSHNNLELE